MENCKVRVLKLAYGIEVRRFEVSYLECQSKIMGVGVLELMRGVEGRLLKYPLWSIEVGELGR